ncbi:hypothetical protein Ddye_002110 [Dipteronia dyeriana]|uniref:Tetraspanin n=1 Tax=Dipteronia dyeriana TaxID=168575 RepID=A0AAE0CU51_9ROSI|nr:hypothetical protein Ddye_002110 [Dipteronia dyeriana]
MVRVSNFLVGFLNLLSLILGLAAIAMSLYFFLSSGDTKCQKFLETPLLVIGMFLTVVSLMGFVGSCCRVNFLLVIYLIVVFFMILGILAFTVFLFMVTNARVAQAFDKTKTMDYSNWLQNHFVNGNKWNDIRNCLKDSHLCSRIGSHGSVAEFYKKNFTPIQDSCCNPPKECGFEYKNATFWTAPKKGPAVADSDCKTWSNEQQTLCYDCNSCKRGFLSNVKKEWRNLMIFNLCVLLLMICTYTFGCCAKRNNRRDNKFSGYYRNY